MLETREADGHCGQGRFRATSISTCFVLQTARSAQEGNPALGTDPAPPAACAARPRTRPTPSDTVGRRSTTCCAHCGMQAVISASETRTE